jgi:hypothetical protein
LRAGPMTTCRLGSLKFRFPDLDQQERSSTIARYCVSLVPVWIARKLSIMHCEQVFHLSAGCSSLPIRSWMCEKGTPESR